MIEVVIITHTKRLSTQMVLKTAFKNIISAILMRTEFILTFMLAQNLKKGKLTEEIHDEETLRKLFPDEFCMEPRNL